MEKIRNKQKQCGKHKSTAKPRFHDGTNCFTHKACQANVLRGCISFLQICPINKQIVLYFVSEDPNLSVQPSNSPAKPQIPTESPNATESHSVIHHDTTFTTTVRTSTSFSSYEGETSESSLGGRNGMALTSQGIVQNISQCCIFENSTLSPGNNQTSHEKAISVGQKVGISFVVVFMICGIVVIGIFLLYRRKNMTPASTRHELEPMNNPA
nr:uncharacterized protein il15ra [Nothobranchius furzeri]